jgi:predicted ATP-dependent protease
MSLRKVFRYLLIVMLIGLFGAFGAGAERVLIPQENWQELFREAPLEVIPVHHLEEVISLAFPPIRRTGQVSA